MVHALQRIRQAGLAWAGRLLPVLLGSALLLAAAPARADLYAYVDEKGVTHFSSEKLDERYELFFRGNNLAHAQQSRPTPRPVTVPTVGSKLLAFFEISPNYKVVKHHMREAARSHQVDYELLQALIATESGFDAAAVSPKGAVGLMQVLPDTARRYGIRDDKKVSVEKKLIDPGINIATGTRYLRDLIKMFRGKLDLALAAYNAGEGAVQRAGNQIPNYRETQNYVATVLQLYQLLKPPAAASAQRPGLLGGAANRGNMISSNGLGSLQADGNSANQ
jgi:soluble lytic murein transglycosylase-like protein